MKFAYSALFIIALGFIISSGVWSKNRYALISQSEETTGIIIDPNKKGYGNSSIVQAVVEYSDENQLNRYFVSNFKRHTLSKYRNRGSGYLPGEKVRILVNQKLGWAEIKTWKLLSGPIILACAGLSLWTLLGAMWLKESKWFSRVSAAGNGNDSKGADH